MNYYAGIGSRETPNEILEIMENLSKKLELEGYILRSGHAIGADQAFESGIINNINKEIFIADQATPEAIKYASNFHPYWNHCNDYIKKLHGRNAMIILGKDLNTPVKFVICWTKNGKNLGGTGLSIRIATKNNIKIFNLFDKEILNKILKYINK
jgi:hypothetical protein